MPVAEVNTNRPEVYYRRSELVEEIVSNDPGVLVRLGIPFFFLLFIMLMSVCWFIKYPEIVKANVILTSINSPKPIVVAQEGKLIQLKAEEGQWVEKGTILGHLESTANHASVLEIATNVDRIQELIYANRVGQIHPHIKNYFDLGELQIPYQTFLQAFLKYKSVLAGGAVIKEKLILESDLEHLKKLQSNLTQQNEIYEEDITLAQQNFAVKQSLIKDSLISEYDFRNERSLLLSKEIILEQGKSSIVQNLMLQDQKEKEIMELEHEVVQQKILFEQALNTLKSHIDNWKKQYLLIAPIDGSISFSSFIQENQQLTANQTVCYVNPEDTRYYCKMLIPQVNFGKVSIGQTVQLSFPSYPSQEFGLVMGSIEYINHQPTDGEYLAKIALLNGLNTTYNKQLEYREGLKATADILTKEMRLLERFYFNIVEQFQ